MGRGAFAFLALGLCGCAGAPPQRLSPEEGCGLELDSKARIVVWGTYHDVRIALETRAEPESVGPVFPGYILADDTEVYSFPDEHLITYSRSFFKSAAGPPLAARRDGIFFALLDRQGDWSFRWHGLEIRVENDAAWRPTLLWSAELGPEPGQGEAPRITGVSDRNRMRAIKRERVGPTREIEVEELQVATSRLFPVKIRFDLKASAIEVNNRRLEVQRGDRLILGPRGEPRLERAGR